MIPERWKQIDDLLQATIELPEGERIAFLRHACGHDYTLQEEVESLINARENAGRLPRMPSDERCKSLTSQTRRLPRKSSQQALGRAGNFSLPDRGKDRQRRHGCRLQSRRYATASFCGAEVLA